VAFFVISLVLLGLSGFTYWMATFQAEKAMTIRSTGTTKNQDLKKESDSVAQELGAGSFRKYTKVSGKATASIPLKTELSQIDCVWYHYTVIREYERTIVEQDVRGQRKQRIERGQEVVAEKFSHTPFYLDDGTCLILVDPQGSEIEGLKTYSNFQPLGQTSIMIQVNIDLPALGNGTLGYRYEEESIPLGQSLSILAEASDTSGTLTLRKPEKKDQFFIISTKDFNDLYSGLKKDDKLLKVVAVLLAVFAAVMVLLGVFR
jgi:hypothetical protein